MYWCNKIHFCFVQDQLFLIIPVHFYRQDFWKVANCEDILTWLMSFKTKVCYYLYTQQKKEFALHVAHCLFQSLSEV